MRSKKRGVNVVTIAKSKICIISRGSGMRFRGGWRSRRDTANSGEKLAGECVVGNDFGFLEQRRSLRFVRVWFGIGIRSSICVGHCPDRTGEKSIQHGEREDYGEK